MMKDVQKQNDAGLAINRIILGIVFFPHGAQKLLGWFGGYGFSDTMKFFTGTVHLPWIVSFLVIIIEFFGALGLIVGLGSRIFSIALAVVTIGIIFTSHIQYGFFMNWFGVQKGEGIEYFILVLALCLPLAIHGSGRYGLDYLISRRRKSTDQ